MKIEDIVSQWDIDSKIDQTDLGSESLNMPTLHHKYYKIYLGERAAYFKQKNELASFKHLKYEYFLGHLNNPEDLKELGWEPFQKKLLKSDVESYLDADKDLIDKKLKLSMQEEKLTYLEAIIKSINNRGFAIKNAIDWFRFTNGS